MRGRAPLPASAGSVRRGESAGGEVLLSLTSCSWFYCTARGACRRTSLSPAGKCVRGGLLLNRFASAASLARASASCRFVVHRSCGKKGHDLPLDIFPLPLKLGESFDPFIKVCRFHAHLLLAFACASALLCWY